MRSPDFPYCEGGAHVCEVCVGSCGVEEYLDDLDIIATVNERKATDTGERISIEEMVRRLGFDPDELKEDTVDQPTA